MRTTILIIFQILICLTKSNSQSYFDNLEKNEKSQNKIVYWEYGLIQFEKNYAKEKVAKHFGFSFSHVFGCVVTKEIISRIARHNRKVDRLLSKQIGKSWRDSVHTATDSVYKIDTTLITHFYLDKVLVDALDKIDAEIKEPYEFRVTSTSNPSIYIINAFLIDKDWNVTGKSILKIEATYPNITYKIITEDKKNSLQQKVLRQRGAANKSSSAVLLSATYRADRTRMSNRIYFQLLYL